MATRLPHNQDVEDTLTGYLLMRPEDVIAIDLTADDFYQLSNRTIYATLNSMIAAGRPVDLVTLADELNKNNKLADAGGAVRLWKLVSDFVPGFDIREAAKIIRDASMRRNMIGIGSDIARAAFDKTADISSVASGFIDRLSRLDASGGGAEHWARYLRDLLDDIDRRAADPKDIWGIQTGFIDFDKMTGGVQPGELIIMSGKPGVGKSMLAMCMAEKMAANEPGAIYSIEMKGVNVLRRLVSAGAKVQASALKSGRVTDSEYESVLQLVTKLEKLPVYMDDNPEYSTAKLRADLHRLKLRHGVKWFVFDYLMLAKDGIGGELNETERTSMISRGMKQICRSLDVGGILIHSMNKSGIGNEAPDQSNLRGSAQVSYDADLICFLNEFTPITGTDGFIPKDQTVNMRTMFFAKGREIEKPNKYIHLIKHPNYPFFADYITETRSLNP